MATPRWLAGWLPGLLIGPLQRNLKSELKKILNCDDMQKRAEQLLSPGAWAPSLLSSRCEPKRK